MPFQPRGLYFEDLAVGFKAATAGRTITEADVMAFAGVTGDWNPLHVDAEFSKGEMFGERVAHGMLGLSTAVGLAVQQGFFEGTIEAFMGLDWKFTGPIKFGDTIYAEAEVAQKKAAGASGIVIFTVTVTNQRGEVVQKGKWTALVKSRTRLNAPVADAAPNASNPT